MSNELAIMPVLEMSQAIERKNAIANLMANKVMVSGVDYGTVGNTTKPTLLKAGAEKLCSFFGFSPEFEIVEITNDWTGQDHGGEPFFNYHYRCILKRGDWIIGQGLGSCNSWETKYRYRWVDEYNVPSHLNLDSLDKQITEITEFGFAISNKETTGKYGKPLEYWNEFEVAMRDGTAIPGIKKTAAGKEYEAWTIRTTLYRVPNKEIFSQVNTIDKMAQKRALVAAVLIAANASEFFTQDLEDMDIEIIQPEPKISVSPMHQPEPEPVKQKLNRPLPPEKVKASIAVLASKVNGGDKLADTDLNDQMWHALKLVCDHDLEFATKLLGYLIGPENLGEVLVGNAKAIIQWAGISDVDDMPNKDSIQEAKLILESLPTADEDEVPF